jgi:hypothetical protein
MRKPSTTSNSPDAIIDAIAVASLAATSHQFW